MMRRAAMLGAVLILTASCDFGRLQPDGRPVREVWEGGGPDLRVSEDASPTRAAREIPILSAPEVFAAYVPSHVDRSRDVVVGEHWVYFKLKEGEWFVERGLEPAPDPCGDAPEALMAPLRALGGLDRAVVPWKEGRP